MSTNINDIAIVSTSSLHIINHEPFGLPKCELCAKFFKAKTYLKRHIQICHSDRRPHKCTKCEKAFKTAFVLKEHFQSIHSDLRSFKCSSCDKCFKTKSKLTSHIRHVHADIIQLFDCSFCQKSFQCQGKQRTHEERDHLQYALNQPQSLSSNSKKSSRCFGNLTENAYKLMHTKTDFDLDTLDFQLSWLFR